MPERMIKPEILTDDAVDQLSAEAEVFYRRLFSVVDDYGRFDGRLPVLRAALFPLKLATVVDAHIEEWLGECIQAGLLRAYAVEGKPFIAFTDFNQRLRNKRSKWPEPPPVDGECQHLTSIDVKRQQATTNAPETETKTETKAGAEATRARAPEPAPQTLRVTEGPFDFEGNFPAPEGAIRPEDDPIVKAVCRICNVMALGVSQKRDREILSTASLIRQSGGSADWVAEFAEYKRQAKGLAPGDTLRMQPAWIADDWGEFLAQRSPAGRAAPLRLVPPEGMSPGEQKRWVEERLREQSGTAATA